MRDTIESADILYGVGNGLSLCLELTFLAPWKRDVTALELYSVLITQLNGDIEQKPALC